jgi:hypothetical protein
MQIFHIWEIVYHNIYQKYWKAAEEKEKPKTLGWSNRYE